MTDDGEQAGEEAPDSGAASFTCHTSEDSRHPTSLSSGGTAATVMDANGGDGVQITGGAVTRAARLLAPDSCLPPPDKRQYR
jgi:hypothetical protein